MTPIYINGKKVKGFWPEVVAVCTILAVFVFMGAMLFALTWPFWLGLLVLSALSR